MRYGLGVQKDYTAPDMASIKASCYHSAWSKRVCRGRLVRCCVNDVDGCCFSPILISTLRVSRNIVSLHRRTGTAANSDVRCNVVNYSTCYCVFVRRTSYKPQGRRVQVKVTGSQQQNACARAKLAYIRPFIANVFLC